MDPFYLDPLYRRFFPHEPDATGAFHQAVEACLPERGAILDLGCGDHRALACHRTPDRQVWGVDFAAHPRLEHREFFRELAPDGAIPFPDDSFDVVAALWVVEHVAEPESFLREVARVLKPGGCFVALTADARHYVTWMIRLLQTLPHAVTQRIVFRLYGRPPADTHPTCFRLNTPGRIDRTAALTGLSRTELRRFANPNYLSFCPPLRRAAIVADWLLEKFLPGWGRIYFVVTLQKGTGVARLTRAA
jgi:SAM-dependent methyltransferase